MDFNRLVIISNNSGKDGEGNEEDKKNIGKKEVSSERQFFVKIFNPGLNSLFIFTLYYKQHVLKYYF